MNVSLIESLFLVELFIDDFEGQLPNEISQLATRFLELSKTSKTEEHEAEKEAPVESENKNPLTIPEDEVRKIYKEAYPKNQEQMEVLAAIGSNLRQLHLMESIPAGINSLGISYVGQGNDVVDDYEWHDNTVWINKDNGFRGIAEDVWTYYVGGYQPMQKWLQYRRKRRLTSDEILHFERMAYAIRESINLIKKLDEIDV